MLPQLPSVTLGRNPDREVRVFGAQSGKASKRTQGRNRKAEIEEEDAKATRNRWTGKLGKHLLCLRPGSHSLTDWMKAESSFSF